MSQPTRIRPSTAFAKRPSWRKNQYAAIDEATTQQTTPTGTATSELRAPWPRSPEFQASRMCVVTGKPSRPSGERL